MAIYIGTVNGIVNDIHDTVININISGTSVEQTTDDVPCTDITQSKDFCEDNIPASQVNEPSPNQMPKTCLDYTSIFNPSEVYPVEECIKELISVFNNSATPSGAYKELRKRENEAKRGSEHFHLKANSYKETAKCLEHYSEVHNSSLYKKNKHFTEGILKSVESQINSKRKIKEA